jgi:hypothetical protein
VQQLRIILRFLSRIGTYVIKHKKRFWLLLGRFISGDGEKIRDYFWKKLSFLANFFCDFFLQIKKRQKNFFLKSKIIFEHSISLGVSFQKYIHCFMPIMQARKNNCQIKIFSNLPSCVVAWIQKEIVRNLTSHWIECECIILMLIFISVIFPKRVYISEEFVRWK